MKLNFSGQRSSERDVESEILLYTEDEGLKQEMEKVCFQTFLSCHFITLMPKPKKERKEIFKDSRQVTLEELDSPSRRDGVVLRFFAWLLRGFF